MNKTTLIHDIAWLVAWAGTQHVYLRDADLAFANGAITHVGKGLDIRAERRIDGSGLLVMPGLVNIHTHAQSEAMRKGITDETRSPGFWHSSLYEHLPVFNPADEEGREACLNVALAELLLSGVTTAVDLSLPYDGWLDALAASGIRGVAAPMFRDARWSTANGHSLDYDWTPGVGARGLERALQVIELARQHPSGRLSGMVAPSQVDTCTEETLRDSHTAARERNLPGRSTPRSRSPNSTKCNGAMVDHRSSGCTTSACSTNEAQSRIASSSTITHGCTGRGGRDLDLFRDSGATVAHCPTVFSRRGIALNTFGDYRRHGVALGLGTDTYPHNMLDEMRTAAVAARLVAGSVDDLDYREIFHAATVGGASALGRDDLGRISVGARADLVAIDLAHPAMRPVREPLRTLIVVAAERAVRDVWVDGERVVADGKILTIDLGAELDRLEAGQKAMIDLVPRMDWAGRTVDALAPMMLETVKSVEQT